MFSFKVIRKLPPPKVQLAIVKQEVIKQTSPLVKQYISQRETVTAKFRNKPKYASRFYVRDTGLLLTIYLKNAKQRIIGGSVTIATLMMWLFETGTRPHVIRAKNARFLVFEKGTYNRKTEGGSGLQGTGVFAFRKSVQHPGFAPSKRMESIDKRLGPGLKGAIDRGVRIGLNRAKRG